MKNISVIISIIVLFNYAKAQGVSEYPFDNLIINAEHVVKFEAFVTNDKIYFKWTQYKDTIPGIYILQKLKNGESELVVYKENVISNINNPILFTAQTTLTDLSDKFILSKVPFPQNILMQIENNENAIINPVVIDNKIHFIVVNQQKKSNANDEYRHN